MIRGIFILLIVCIVFIGGAFLLKDKLDITAVENFNIDKITGALSEDIFKETKAKLEKNLDKKVEKTKVEEKTVDKNTQIYFVKADDGEVATLSTTKKEVKTESERFRATMEALFSGPSGLEKIAGVYSEIPSETKLLEIRENATSYTINISDDFENGGGADSMKIRVKQLITTATSAAGKKDVYLEINGERVEYVGGEGIVILQPLQRNLK